MFASPKRVRKCLTGVVIGLVFLSLGACSFIKPRDLRGELANRGPVVLSPDNPYLAANAFLAEEIAQSETMRGFVGLEGTPDALEVTNTTFEAMRVHFYYVSKAKTYTLEQYGENWLILGPAPLSPEAANMLTTAGVSPGRAAKLREQSPTALNGAQSYSAPSSQVFESEEILVDASRESPTYFPAQQSGTASLPPTLNSAANISYDESGDILHKVAYPGETLRLITTWYTGDVENTERIARINSLSNPNVLRLGQSIRIPRYLINQSIPLPASEVEAYRSRTGSHPG